MENKDNGVFSKSYIKLMAEELDMVYKKKMSKNVQVREEWKIHEKDIELKGLIGRGSLGNVHRGIYCNGDEEPIDVAVKVYEWGEESKETETIGSSRKAIFHEISIWKKLQHPNIAELIGAIYSKAHQGGQIQKLENITFVAMEYLPRGTLKSYLVENSKTKLPFEVVIQLALGLAKGLSHLHSKKIAHRNVQTKNVLLDKNFNAKLTNFKVACCESDSNLYKITGVTGTIGYTAPEVLKEIPYDHSCDVYSFGICLWEIYCCEIYCCDKPNMRPIIPRRCPKSLGRVMKKCWDEDPKRRPEMRDIVNMLEAIDVSRMTPEEEPSSWLSCLWQG